VVRHLACVRRVDPHHHRCTHTQLQNTPMEFLLYSSEDFPMEGCPCEELPSDVPDAYRLSLVRLTADGTA